MTRKGGVWTGKTAAASQAVDLAEAQKDLADDARDWALVAQELDCEPTREEILKTVRNLFKQNLEWADALAKAREEIELLKRKVRGER